MTDIVIISWNRYELIREMLLKIKQYTVTPHRVIIIDNGSNEQYIDKLCKLKNEHLYDEIILNKDKYYSYAIVQSYQVTTSDPFIISDGDVNPSAFKSEESEDWLAELLNLSHGTGFGIVTTNTQLNAIAILGRHQIKSMPTVAWDQRTGQYKNMERPSGRGIMKQGRLGEAHCAPLWLAAMTRKAVAALYTEDYHLYRGGNPDLVYSNMLRGVGLPVGMALKVRGVHTGLGWNRGYDPSILKDDGPFARPNIPTTKSGIPVYRKHTLKHWWEMETEYEEDIIDYDYDNFDVQKVLMAGVHTYYQYLRNEE